MRVLRLFKNRVFGGVEKNYFCNGSKWKKTTVARKGHRSSLKGCTKTAQGNALGTTAKKSPIPVGALQLSHSCKSEFAADSRREATTDIAQGLRPWVIDWHHSRPARATENDV